MIQNIYEELNKFPKRIRRKQKQEFLNYLDNKLHSFGYETEISEGRYILKSKNLLTKSTDPQIIIGAHYDTPTILPFYFEYIFKLFGHTRQIFMMVGIFLLVGLITPIVVHIDNMGWLINAIKYTFYLSFLSMFIPNWQNQNDNTSGVASLLLLAQKIGNDDFLRGKVQFIFFDNEELGLLGSLMQKSKMKKLGFPFRDKKFISIDCVGRGEVPVLVYHNKNNSTVANLGEIFDSKGVSAKILRLPFYPISDNYAFAESDGINISWMSKTLIPGGYYIKNVHTPRDNNVDFDKINMVCDGVEEFIHKSLIKVDQNEE